MRALSDTPFGDALLLLVNVWVGSRRISFFVLTLALRSGERGRLARCLWPPAKGVCDRGVTLELSIRSRLRTIRRDAEWCDRDGRAPRIDSRISRLPEPALYRRKAANCSENEMRPSEAVAPLARLAGDITVKKPAMISPLG